MNKEKKIISFTFEQLVSSVRQVHEALSAHASKAVNISLTIRNWLIGCYIAEYELHGTDRAKYGDALLSNFASKLTGLGVSACARRQLYQYLRFYRTYPGIVRSLTAQFQQLVPESLATDQKKVQSTTALSGLDPMKIAQRLSYRRNMMAGNDNPPIGILLCTQKDHALVEYALAGIDNHLFVSKYQLELPKKEDIERFIEREIAETVIRDEDSGTGRLVRELRAKYGGRTKSAGGD